MQISRGLFAIAVIISLLIGAAVASTLTQPTTTEVAAEETATPTREPKPTTPTPKRTPTSKEPTPTAELEAENTEENVESVCIADKQYTAHEGTGPHRLEVTMGDDDKGHLDYYSTPGVKSISVGVEPGESGVFSGYGSLWLFPLRDCEEYDLIADMEAYAQARKSHGHSGLVWKSLSSWIAGEEPVVNLWKADPSQYRPVLWGEEVAAEATESPAMQEACSEAIREDHQPGVGETWSPCTGDTFRIINFWTNQPGADQTERKLFLEPGQDPSLLGGGSAWCWDPNCGEVAREEFEKNPLPPTTLDQLRTEGLVQ